MIFISDSNDDDVSLLLDEYVQLVSGLLGCHEIADDALLSKFRCTKKKDLRRCIRVLGKCFLKIFAGRITDDDEFLRHLQIPLQQIFTALKIAIAPLVKYVKISAGMIAVIWHHKIDHITVADSIQD